MTRDEALTLYAAWLDGKTLQHNHVAYEGAPVTWKDWPPASNGLTPPQLHSTTLHWRIKPEPLTINGHEVPTPEHTALSAGVIYYSPGLTVPELVNCISWEKTPSDHRRLQRGLVHLTKDAAVAHAKALLSFTEQNIE